METRVTVKNYRCFPADHPASFVFGEGFTGLVGMNNAGKSALLRLFFEFRQLFRAASQTQHLATATKTLVSGGNLAEVSDIAEVFTDTNSGDLLIEIEPLGVRPRTTLPVFQQLNLRIPRSQTPINFLATFVHDGREYPGTDCSARPEGVMTTRQGDPVFSFAEVDQVLAPFWDTIYIPPFRNVINTGSGQSYDMRIGQAFVAEWRTSKTGASKEANQRIVRLTEDIRQIFEFKSLEINASDDGTTLTLVIDDKSYKLNELGSGIAEFILALGAAATQRPRVILIDEPELHLHPSLQIDFLTRLASYAELGTVFATHNLGLARAIATRLYSFRRTVDGMGEMTEFSSTTNLAEFLGEMSFAGYRALGFENVLLVEGQTDVTTVLAFLRKYKKDHTVIPLPLRGSSVISGSEKARRDLQGVLDISSRVFALIDSERAASGDPLAQSRADFQRLCTEMGIGCKVMDRRAIENYFSDSAVKKVRGQSARALGPFETRTDLPFLWPKGDNWRVAIEMTREELDATDLGPFLANLGT